MTTREIPASDLMSGDRIVHESLIPDGHRFTDEVTGIEREADGTIKARFTGGGWMRYAPTATVEVRN